MFENCKIFILGMARSGYEAAKVLAHKNNKIVINDQNENQDQNHINELEKLGVKVILGNQSAELIDDTFDYVIKNPGIKDSHDIIQRARKLNIPVINEVEMCYRLLPENVTIIGVTGSNGKTTTTTLIHEILKKAKLPVVLAGNIGYPLSSKLNSIKSNDILLMEISIQQLCNFEKFKTNISVLTNIYDAHLDFVGNKENYINIKKRIFYNHTDNDYAILNFDNECVMNNFNDILSQKEYFSKYNCNSLCHIVEDEIIYNNRKIISLKEVMLKGDHNYENVMAAIMVAKKLKVDDRVIVNVLKNFSGVEHRIEFVREMNGIKIYNDSKSTNVKATEIALSSFQEPTILLLGGLERNHSFDELTAHMKNVKLVVSFGETKKRIAQYCKRIGIDCFVEDNLKNAVDAALSNAKEGDVILLSPACASWDQFKDYEERGIKFKEYINNK